MSKPPRTLTQPQPIGLQAVEAKPVLQKAHREWARRFGDGSSRIGGRRDEIFWADDQQFWSRFRTAGVASTATSFRTFVGVQQGRFSSNAVVEINLPYAGDDSDIQGLIARDVDGHQWVLHHGRMHVNNKLVRHEMFASFSGATPVNVRFSSGEFRPYFVVTNLDAPPSEMRAQMRDFVRLCERVKARMLHGQSAADDQALVDDFERRLFPEAGGLFTIPAQLERIGDRWHADVFDALVKELKAVGCNVANERIGRYGPDLYTACHKPKLFELKTGVGAAEIQQAIGQLFLYEKILKREYQKVLVLPEWPNDELAPCLAELGIRVLKFRRHGGKVVFDPSDVLVVMA